MAVAESEEIIIESKRSCVHPLKRLKMKEKSLHNNRGTVK